MHAALQPGAAPPSEPGTPARTASLRLGIGLVQGLVLYVLYFVASRNFWPATEPLLFTPLRLLALCCPILIVSALGHLTRRQLLQWIAVAAVIVAGLALYDVWRAGTPPPGQSRSILLAPSGPLGAALVAGLFIAHALVLSGARDRRRVAAYATYFDIAWKLGVQLAFSALFVGITWLALQLGAELFKLVKITFLADLIRKPWFWIPVTAFAFSSAMHLTDVRPAIVQGIRGLLLVLASWVLPVLTLIVAGFLLSLPFTGLAPLWATRWAATVLLFAAAALVILINAAWQNGTAPVATPIRFSARVAALLLAPLVAIAVYALALRVGDYGWTHDRIVAASCMLVAGCYALGYGAAALRRGWLALLAPVNVGTAFVVLGLLLLLYSPLLDPVRLSVNDQVARLEAGKTPVDEFDFAYLRFDGKRYGEAALARLEARYAGKPIAERIAAVGKMQNRWDKNAVPAVPRKVLAMLRPQPQGATLPKSFLATDWATLPRYPYPPDCLRGLEKSCDVYQLDVTGDDQAEIIVVGSADRRALVFQEGAGGKWRAIADASFGKRPCKGSDTSTPEALPRAVAPGLLDVEIGGQRVRLDPVAEPSPPCR